MVNTNRIERRTWLAAGLALLLLGGGWSTPADGEDRKTVTVVIDYSDGVEKHFTAIPWTDEMTALDAMRAAARHPRGIKFEHKGQGATALLTKIDDLENEGKGRNWLYRVNGKLADRSFGVFTLDPEDTVLWKFEKYR